VSIIHTSACPRAGCQAEMRYESSLQIAELRARGVLVGGSHLERPDPDCRVIFAVCHVPTGTVELMQEWVNDSPPGGPVRISIPNDELMAWGRHLAAPGEEG
jgi:hypothetical protein